MPTNLVHNFQCHEESPCLFIELRDTQATLSLKINDSVRDITTKLCACKNLVTSTVERLVAVENSHTAMAAELAALKATLNAASNWATVASPAPALLSPTPPLVVSDVVRELDMRAFKKANIVLSGLRFSSIMSDSIAMHDLLRDELRINATVVHCIRLGKPSADTNRPQRLLVALSSDADARTAVCFAKNLRNSRDTHTRDHVCLNADLTPEQRMLDYNLRSELKRLQAAGEQDLIIRNSRLHTKPRQPAVVAAPHAPASDPSD